VFRQRISTALLSHNPLMITNIRSNQDTSGSGGDGSMTIGLHDFEANFLRLIEKIADGCTIEINETGTSLKFKPGILVGGKITHDCGSSRSIGWFIEGILPLAMFCKQPLQLSLTGITNDALDLSVDILQNVTLPLLRNFGINGAKLTVKRRGCPPKGGGIVELYLPITRSSLQPVHIIDEGLVKRIRGVAFCTKISPTIVSRVIDSCRGVLNHVIPDVYINTDHYKGKEGGDSPGYSLSLVAETTSGVLISVERTANTRKEGANDNSRGELPEDIGRECAAMLLKEIHMGGVIDRMHQPLILQLMVLTPEDVSKVRFGCELTSQAVLALQLIRDAYGVTFKIKQEDEEGEATEGTSGSDDAEEEDSDGSEKESADRPHKHWKLDQKRDGCKRSTIVVSCLGVGFSNVNRKVT